MVRLRHALLCAALAAGAAPGVAGASGPSYTGGCALAATRDGGSAVAWHGTVAATVVAHDTQAPVTVGCTLRVGSGAATTVLATSGAGGVVASEPVSFDASVTDVVEVCTDVAAGAAHDPVRCSTGGLLPQQAEAALDAIRQVEDDWAPPDAILCPVLAALVPGLPAGLVIEDDGDTWVDTGTTEFKLFDCPPYDGEPRRNDAGVLVVAAW